MSIFRTNDPALFDDVDGIIIDESAPPPSVQGVAANVAILIGQFQRGPTSLEAPTSIGELHEMYGKSDASGNLALRNKKFGTLKIVRVVAAAATKATDTFQDNTTDIITFTAKHKGAYGNNIYVTISAGSGSTSTYVIEDKNPGSVLAKETYANIAAADLNASLFSTSKLVDVTVVATSSEPDPVAATALSGGSDGTVADTDYETALATAGTEMAGNVVFLDVYNSIRNGYLKTHAAATQDRMVICAFGENDDLATCITSVGSLRDSDGRIIAAFPWVQTTINGVPTYTSPASWMASLISQTPAHIDVASTDTLDFMAGATGLKYKLTRAGFIQAKDAGLAAFEQARGYIKVKSGVVTQIANSSKVMILRRRMADYLTNSIGMYLENYQNKPNKKSNRQEIAAGIYDFVDRHERDGILPKDSEVSTGKAKIVDTESLNTDSSLALGFVKIKYKQRIFSSMRFIVLQAEIGESVVVTEAE